VSLASLLDGLTHDGFYRHFASRDDLVTEAIERALREGSRAVAAVATEFAVERDDARAAALEPMLEAPPESPPCSAVLGRQMAVDGCFKRPVHECTPSLRTG
jgi:AcrR family transcriptional regulator